MIRTQGCKATLKNPVLMGSDSIRDSAMERLEIIWATHCFPMFISVEELGCLSLDTLQKQMSQNLGMRQSLSVLKMSQVIRTCIKYCQCLVKDKLYLTTVGKPFFAALLSRHSSSSLLLAPIRQSKGSTELRKCQARVLAVYYI